MLLKKAVRGIAWLILFPLLISGCGGGKPATATPLPLTVRLSEVSGTVKARNPGDADFTAASNDFILQVQGQIITGEGGRVQLNYSTGTSSRLASNTTFTLISNDPQPGGLLTRIRLDVGRIWIALKGGSMDVETPSGQASVRGSYMMVWVDPGTQNVYVNCFEGTCGAENSSASYGMGIGDGRILYHVETGKNPPPPAYYRLTWQDFEDWAANNPDVRDIFPSIAQTLTAIPPQFTPTFTITPSPTAMVTATAQNCFNLIVPKNGAILPEVGELIFSWSPMPGAAKYVVTFTAPDKTTYISPLTGTTYRFLISTLIRGGTYTWKVGAYDAAGKLLCTAPEFTFKKDVSPTITPTPSPSPVFQGDATFEYENGPTGTYPDCNSIVVFIVSVFDPKGITSVTVHYQSDGGLIGSFPLTEESVDWTGSQTLTIFYMQGTVTWYFVAVDGSGNSEKSPNSYQFMCQGLG